MQCVVWEWQRDDGGFSPYSPDMSFQIEAAYSTGTGNYTMVDHTVHFTRMVQKKHNTGWAFETDRGRVLNILDTTLCL